MAIVFVSPTKKRSKVLWLISASLVLVIMGIAVFIFLPELKKQFDVAGPEEVLFLPEVVVNVNIIDSDRVKKLTPFSAVAVEFEYVATDRAAKSVSGTVVAESTEEATAMLEAKNLTVTSIQPLLSGRLNPFEAYSQPIKPIDNKK